MDINRSITQQKLSLFRAVVGAMHLLYQLPLLLKKLGSWQIHMMLTWDNPTDCWVPDLPQGFTVCECGCFTGAPDSVPTCQETSCNVAGHDDQLLGIAMHGASDGLLPMIQ
jgi:hypothetical protein